jgi:hypothetical protein
MPTQLIFYIQTKSNLTGPVQKVELVTLIQDAVFYIQNVLQMAPETLPLGDEKVYGFI